MFIHKYFSVEHLIGTAVENLYQDTFSVFNLCCSIKYNHHFGRDTFVK